MKFDFMKKDLLALLKIMAINILKKYRKSNSRVFQLTILLVNLLLLQFPTFAYTKTDSLQQTGLMNEKCWFQIHEDWPDVNCYFMHVHENHKNRKSKLIKFPVVKFNAPDSLNKAPACTCSWHVQYSSTRSKSD